MKKLLTIVCIFFFLKGASSQDFYYNEGNRIVLEQRTDKLAIVLNTNSYSKEYLLSNVTEFVRGSDELKEISENTYLVKFNEAKSKGEIDNFLSGLSTRNNLIKFATPVYFGESKKVTQIPTDEFIVRLGNINDKEKLDVMNIENNIQIIGNIVDERGFLLKSNNNVKLNALELSDIYYRSGYFEYAQPNFLFPEYCLLNSTPNDPFYGQQWAISNTGQAVRTGSASGGAGSAYGDPVTMSGIPDADMDVDLAWDFTTGSSLVKVAVIDTGIDSTHPDFNSAGHLLAGYDSYWNKNGVPRDSGSHGTCTAGLIGAVINNATGVAGIAGGCKLMSIRIFNSSGSTTAAALSRAFDTARVRGIDVISNSWGGGTPDATLTAAINNAATIGRGGLGCIILFSTGNDGHNPPSYPSYLSNVIAVGASTPYDQKKSPGTGGQMWWGGNYGSSVSGDIDVTAPTVCYTLDVQGTGGYNNLAGTAGNYDSSFNGTSCSCPNAAGVAALILSVNTSQTKGQVTDALCRGSEKIDNVSYSTNKTYGRWNEYYGYGRVNAYNSVRLAAGVDVTPPTIVHLNISSLTTTYPVSITAEILDQDGSAVPVSGANQPKLFFRLNKNNAGYGAYDSLPAASNAGNNYTFKVPCVGYETQVQYYIRARDASGNQSTFPRGAPNNFWLCYYAIGTFNVSSNKLLGFACATSGINISPTPTAVGSFTIVNTKFQMWVRHATIYQEIIQLYSPLSDAENNRKCAFSANNLNVAGSNITGTTVADSASLFWNSGTPPYTNGLFKADCIMKGFNGTNAAGNWKIMNYDWVSGTAATWDSARVIFTKTTGTTSPSARLNSEADSTLNFGTVNSPDSVTKNFYLKNAGTANLTVSGVTFTGTYELQYKLITALPGPIVPNDSGLFTVRLYTQLANSISKEIENPDGAIVEGALMNIANNDPHKGTFKVSLQSNNELPITQPCNDFSSLVFPPVSLTEEYTGTNYWSRNTVSAYGVGTGAAKFDCYNAASGTVQSLVTNNFANAPANTYVTFDEAYAPFSLTFPGPDTLIVEASSNNGSSFSSIATLLGKIDGTGELNSAPAIASAFTPSNSDWRSKIYSLPVGTNKVRLKAKSGFGNNIYIDNLCIQTLPAPVSNFVGITPQGFYRGTPGIYNGIGDTVTIYLHRADLPNIKVDSATLKIDAFTTTIPTFTKALSGTYYFEVKHRNSIETWSNAGGYLYTRGAVSTFDFLQVNQAFNNNQFQVNVPNNLWGMFGGDIDRNGFVDLSDITLVYNDAGTFVTGYVITDVTGDNLTDLNDIILTYNNSSNFVSVQRPAGAEPSPQPTNQQTESKVITFENNAQRIKYMKGLQELKKSAATELKNIEPNWNPLPSKEYLDKLNEARKHNGSNGKTNSKRF